MTKIHSQTQFWEEMEELEEKFKKQMEEWNNLPESVKKADTTVIEHGETKVVPWEDLYRRWH